VAVEIKKNKYLLRPSILEMGVSYLTKKKVINLFVLFAFSIKKANKRKISKKYCNELGRMTNENI
jgi:hypothetical protein